MKKLLAIIVAIAATFATMPASAVYYLSHWDFGSDPQGEFDYTGHNDLVNDGNVPIVDGAAVFDGTAKSFITEHNVDFSSDKPYTIEPFERVAQIVIAPVFVPDVQEVAELSDTQRGEGGFGSTGRS